MVAVDRSHSPNSMSSSFNTDGMTSMNERARLRAAGLPIPGETPKAEPKPPGDATALLGKRFEQPSAPPEPTIRDKPTISAAQASAPTRRTEKPSARASTPASATKTVSSTTGAAYGRPSSTNGQRDAAPAAATPRTIVIPSGSDKRPTVMYGGQRPEIKIPVGTVLDSEQRRDALEGLGIRKHLIREELYGQVEDIVLGKRTEPITFVPTDIELRIFNMLGIPGF
jgi:hypothetical protein